MSDLYDNLNRLNDHVNEFGRPLREKEQRTALAALIEERDAYKEKFEDLVERVKHVIKYLDDEWDTAGSVAALIYALEKVGETHE